MTQAIEKQQNKQESILDKVQKLTPEQQEKLMEFIEFLEFKAENTKTKGEDEEEISAYEAAKDLAGCVDWGPGDLATNKAYLREMGKK